MGRGGYYADALAAAREAYPIVTHGLTMSLGGFDPLGDAYLDGLRGLLRDVGSPWHSDHLCFGSVDGRSLHDLLPLALTTETARRVADRVRRAEDAIGVPLAVENISFYTHPGRREMREPAFVSEVCRLSGCALVLDVNNAYVNCQNFGLDPDAWMAEAPLDRVVQIHVAGHERVADEDGAPGDTVIVDTHGAPVCDPVLALLERVLRVTGPVPVLLERDQSIPALPVLLREVADLKAIWLRAREAHGRG